MMLTDDDFASYISANFEDISSRFEDENHLSGHCSNCSRDVAFNIIEYRTATRRTYRHGTPTIEDAPKMPRTMVFRCPIRGCGHFNLWIIAEVFIDHKKLTFLLRAMPDDHEEIEGLPDDPPQLKAAYREAVRCLNAGAPLAAAAMLRRGLQIITRDILNTKPGNLASELKQLKGASNPLGIPLTKDFADNAYLLKEAGNQGAHPDADPDLLSFDPKDAEYLHQVFVEVVAEIFVAPAVAKKARDAFLKRRKITP
jgi:hypothetical protein